MQDTIVPQVADAQDYITAVWTFAGAVAVAVVGGIFSLGTLVAKHFLDKRKERQCDNVTVKFTVREWAEIHERVVHVIELTKAERFLILQAENGSTTPEATTVIYAHPEHDNWILAGDVKFELDAYYCDMLTQTEQIKRFTMQTSKMPKGSRLRSLFEKDKICHAHCYFVCKYPLLKDPTKFIILYFMLLTTQKQAFTSHENTQFGLLADWIRNLFSKEIGKK